MLIIYVEKFFFHKLLLSKGTAMRTRAGIGIRTLALILFFSTFSTYNSGNKFSTEYFPTLIP